MLEKILTCKCCHRITRMKEEGISNIYIDDLMKKISCSFRLHFRSIKFLHLRTKNFQLLLIYQKKMKKGRISLE